MLKLWNLNEIEALALKNPKELRDAIPSMGIADMSLAIEALGEADQSPEAKQFLVGLLEHESPIVREGVLYGLWTHMDNELSRIIRTMSKKDPSKAIREVALEIITEYNDIKSSEYVEWLHSTLEGQELMKQTAELDEMSLQYAFELAEEMEEDCDPEEAQAQDA